MRDESRRGMWITLLVLIEVVTGMLLGRPIAAQNPEMQQKVSDVKQAIAMNKQAVAQYTWVEQDTISLKGEQKKQEHFQVRMGPDGKPQKTSLDSAQSSDSGGHEGRLKKHIVEKKKEEYEDYGDQIKALIHQYVPPDKDMIQQAYQQGNIMMGPEGAPGEFRLVISNYIKQGDKMTLVVDKTQMGLLSVSIATYLNDPSDAVNVSVQFSRIPGGPNHVSTETINGVSKKLTIVVQNSNYQHL
jgi:hypothetical protein